MQNLTDLHFQVLTHTLNYVAYTIGQGILLQFFDDLKLHAYTDSDWGACLDTRKSITGYVILFGDSLVSCKSKKQHTVSRSSSKAEYRVMAAVASEIVLIVRLLEELGVKNIKHISLECDNISALWTA